MNCLTITDLLWIMCMDHKSTRSSYRKMCLLSGVKTLWNECLRMSHDQKVSRSISSTFNILLQICKSYLKRAWTARTACINSASLYDCMLPTLYILFCCTHYYYLVCLCLYTTLWTQRQLDVCRWYKSVCTNK